MTSRRPPAPREDKTPEDLLTRHPILWRYQRDHLISKAKDWQSADYPAIYQEAKRVLAACEAIDEANAWKDKAAALAGWAKVTHDDELFALAKRIQLRAYRRCGELLKEIPPANGRNQNILDVDVEKVVTRESAAAAAGLSERQRCTSLRLASVDGEVFDEKVESAVPPTVAEMEKLGTRRRTHARLDELRNLNDAPPETVTQLARAPKSIFYSAQLERTLSKNESGRGFFPIDRIARKVANFAAWCRAYDSTYWAGCSIVAHTRDHIALIRAWLDDYEAHLPEEDVIVVPWAEEMEEFRKTTEQE